MPDLATIRGGPAEWGSAPASSAGVTLTANASANTKATSFTTLIAAMAYRTSWLMLTIGDANSGASYLIDIAIGAAASEVVFFADILYHQVQTTSVVGGTVLILPFPLPEGARLSARCQSSVGGATIKVTAHLIASPIDAPPPLGVIETVGAVTASTRGTLLNDPGATPHTDGTWTQIVAATTHAWRWLVAVMANPSDTAYAGVKSDLVDLAVGAAAAEVEFFGDLWSYGNASTDAVLTQAFCFPVAIPAGTRISARHRCSTGTAGDRRMDVILHGVG